MFAEVFCAPDASLFHIENGLVLESSLDFKITLNKTLTGVDIVVICTLRRKITERLTSAPENIDMKSSIEVKKVQQQQHLMTKVLSRCIIEIPQSSVIESFCSLVGRISFVY